MGTPERAVPARGQSASLALDRVDTAVVFIDPQNDVLSDKGAAWAAGGESVRENKTVENMERIFQATKQHGFDVFISPHYFYPTDSGWKFNGPLESLELSDKIFARRGALTLDGFRGSRSSSAECWQTSASSLTCVISSNRASRWWWRGMRRRARVTPSGGTDTRRR